MKKNLTNIGIDYLKRHPRLRQSVRKAVLRCKKSNYVRTASRFEVDPKLVVFEAYMGKNCCCSPRALYEQMAKNPAYDGYSFVWAFSDCAAHRAAGPLHPDLSRSRLVEYKSKEYYETYAKAGIFITNSRLPEEIVRKHNQVFVQCWHGTPLKRLGHDVIENSENSLNTSGEMKTKSDLDAIRYSYMISPSPFCTEKFRSAFNLKRNNPHVRIIEEGYPRNDFLFQYTVDDISHVKNILGIPQEDQRKIILYAPTFRDNQHASGVGYTLDLQVDFDAWQEKLSDEYIVLFRAHYFIANAFDFEKYRDFVFDVSSFDDINYLYIVSDVLITDYSSVFFDFANLRRPILFYMYDLDEYKGKLRDFYFDLSELPGPVIEKEMDLLDAIEKLDVDQAPDAHYLAFNQKFNPKDDGSAAARVLNEIFGTIDATRVMQKSLSVRRKPGIRRILIHRGKHLVTAVGKKVPWVRKAAFADYEKLRKKKYRKCMEAYTVDDKLAVFESYMGKSYACSPKAIYQYMVKSGKFKDFKFVWAFKDMQKLPELILQEPELASASFVEYDSDEYYRVYATAKYFVSNSRLPNYIIKKDNQVYVQTWHGSTFKKLGYDICKEGYNVLSSAEFLREQYDKDASRYTYLVSPSAFCTGTYRSGFNLAKNNSLVKIIEKGYPRDDYLVNRDGKSVEEIRRMIGIPESDRRKVILYAPTWRDSDHKTGVGFVLDLPVDFSCLQRELGDDYIILFRAHYFIGNTFDFGKYEGFLYDVSKMDDINYLYVVSDVLVTDYSSVFYDYANLRRPIIFYMYDRQVFSDSVRDFYLTIEELPGPVVENEEGLISALNQYQSGFEPDEKYENFNRKFNGLHDGHASENVVQEVFGR
jgi:CDP-glycerol glycerophosphotransferase